MASKSYGWDVRNIAKISPKMAKKQPFFDFRFSQKLSIRFERNFLQIFYTILESYMCNGIKIVWLGCEKQPKLAQKWSKKGHFSTSEKNLSRLLYRTCGSGFNTIRNLDVISGVRRYIRIIDVISEVYSLLLRRRRRLENKRFHLSQHAISELLKHFPGTEGFLWVKLFCEFFI